ncbi:hypothetical protein GBF35_25715 [Nonomuraea phyllanthi]|uniref:hypothetical protein n=1 Tax=Nonomuraea phyllanthi TaxID=2219224 RepID=UPI0012932859|nr:hypothetical protein [Nonomuraea phyllanthi]QFY09597.1 hypothetical protein GBF35_25715 [Nonomuraea phyllanthi]
MRPLYVESENLSTDRIGYMRHEHEAALSIGAYRLPTSTNDLGALKENAILYRKIAEAAEHAYRDVSARATFLENQEEQRRLAAAHTHAAAARPAPAPAAPCMCGEPAAPNTMHRAEAPCYRADSPPCPTCQGKGCPSCANSGLAIVNPPQHPAGTTNALRLVHDDTRAPMPSTAAFNPPARPPATPAAPAGPGH